MTLHAALLTIGNVVGVLALLNFMFGAPLEKSWRQCCMRAAVPVAIWSSFRLATIIIFHEPYETPMLGFFLAPLVAVAYAVIARVIVQGVLWIWRILARSAKIY